MRSLRPELLHRRLLALGGPAFSTTTFDAGAGRRVLVASGLPSARPYSSDLCHLVGGQTLEGQYIATFPATRASVTTRFRFKAERE